MVKMEKRPRTKVPERINLQGITLYDKQYRSPDKDLPGFRSHVRYSVFKDRRHVKPPARGPIRRKGP